MRRLTGWLAGAALAGVGWSAWAQYPHTAEIVEVSGRWTGSRAEVVWSTGSEYGTAGFRIYRQGSDGEVPIHDGWISADITRPVGSYTGVDADQTQGAEASYRIEELRGDGFILTLGVWGVTFEEPPVLPVARAMSFEPLFSPMSEPVLVAAPAAKVRVESNDVVSVSYEALGSVLGLTQADVAGRAAEASLVVRCGGELISYWPDEAGQRLFIYVWQAKSRYTQYNVFWIEPGMPGEGRLMQRREPDVEPGTPDQTFTGLVDVERDLVPSMVNHSGTLRDDLYFWTHVQVNTNSPQMERIFDAPLEGYAGGDVEVTVRVTGWNDVLAENPDHQIEVLFNTNSIGLFTFDGKADAQATFTAPSASVLESGNQLKIRGVLLPGLSSSTILIQGYSLEYLQDYRRRSGPLEAHDGGHERLMADGYTDVVVLDVTDPYDPVLVANETGVLPEGAGWSVQADTRWIYRERSAIPSITLIPAGHGGWLRSATNTVDYLVIAPRAFEGPAQRLADHRAGQGLRTAVAYYEDICDSFAYGVHTPEAIRTLLIYAHEHWEAAPWMAVLGGWGHHDYYGAQTTAVNHLPSLLGSDSKTLRPADGLFADLTGNEVPDLAIGRIPAQSAAQFNGYIDKVQAYEAGGAQASHQNIFFISDNADGAGNFTATNLELASETATRYTATHTTLDSKTVAGVKADINAAFSAGVGIMHYTGHGSYQQLAGENLLHYNEVTGRVNPSLPLFLSLTCLIGRFDMLGTRTLGEGLVLQPEGGVLAVYAPSGLSWNDYAELFGKELYRLHAEERAETIGLLLRRARRSFGELSGLHADAIRTYNLLGDPALKLQGGAGGTPPWWSPSFVQWRWESRSYSELEETGELTGNALFADYAAGGHPEGLRVTRKNIEPGTGRAVVEWNQRRLVSDLDYRLMISTNLLSGVWEESPPDVEWVKTSHSDPALERVEARIPFGSDPFFIRIITLSK